MIGNKTGAIIFKDFNKSRKKFIRNVKLVNYRFDEDSQDHLINLEEQVYVYVFAVGEIFSYPIIFYIFLNAIKKKKYFLI